MAKMYENKDKSIMCPNCGKFLTKADSRDDRVHKLRCRHCWKWIHFKPCDEEDSMVKDVPQRHCSSGCRFY